MTGIYIAILVFSTAFATAMMLRAHRQLAPVFHLNRYQVGGLIIAPAIGFMMVVVAPPLVLFAAGMLTAIGWWDEYKGIDRPFGMAITLLAASMGIGGLPSPAWFTLPAWLVMIGLWLFWWQFTLQAERLPHRLYDFMLAMLAAFMPLIAAPIFTKSPNSLVLDIALIISAFCGALVIVDHHYKATLALRLPAIYLLGYAICRTIIAGAWPFALASIGLMAVVFLRNPPHPHHPHPAPNA